MSRRSGSHRVLSALSGVWFALFSLLPPASVPCPMHEAAAPGAHAAGTMAATAATAAMPSGHEGHDGHAAHAAAHAAAQTAAPASPQAPAPIHPCDCATACCGVANMLLLDAPRSLATVRFAPDEPVAVHHALLRRIARARLLPFANGPPDAIAG